MLEMEGQIRLDEDPDYEVERFDENGFLIREEEHEGPAVNSR